MAVLVKTSLKYIQNDWDTRGIGPRVTNWNDESVKRGNFIADTNALVNLHALEQLDDAAATDMDISTGTAFRCLIRAAKDPDSLLYGIQTAYNQGEYPAGENLTTGKITWNVPIGPITYAITAVAAGSKTFGIAGDWTTQILAADTLTISGSTGNDGDYTVDGTPTYSSGTNTTSIVVVEAVPDGTVDGNIEHSALQNATYDTDGGLEVFIECNWTNATAEPQALLPAFPSRIHERMDDTPAAVAGAAVDTFLTLADALALFAQLVGSDDIEIDTSGKGIILQSPDTTRYRIIVNNGGILNVAAV